MKEAPWYCKRDVLVSHNRTLQLRVCVCRFSHSINRCIRGNRHTGVGSFLGHPISKNLDYKIIQGHLWWVFILWVFISTATQNFANKTGQLCFLTVSSIIASQKRQLPRSNTDNI